MNLPPAADALARRQFGAIARIQLLEWMTEGQVEGLVDRGVLVPIERGVYVVTGGARPPEQRVMAALLRCRPKARVTGAFVLGLLDVDGYTRHGPFEILTRRRVRGVTFPNRRDPDPSLYVATHGPMAVTGAPLAWVHSLGDLDPDRWRSGRVAFHCLQWRGLIDVERVALLLEQLPRTFPGVHVAGRFLDEGALRSESVPEADLGEILSTFHPAPKPQVWVAEDIRVDWLFEDLGVVVEYQGAVDHSGALAEEADAARIARLGALGLVVVEVRAPELRDPAALRVRIAGVLAARAVELGRTFSLR